jgi:nucleoid DNA-binding protein
MDNKTLTEILAKRLNRKPEDIEKLLEAFIATVKNRCGELDSVAIPGFGTFEAKKRLERVSINPATGKRMLIPPKVTLSFKPSALLKNKLR